ncbi:MAG: hypothetical protein Q8M43_10620, partial [Sulfuricurvum sp.]
MLEKVYKFSLKTKDINLSIERRNKILTSLDSSNLVKHDKITLSITLKILGIKKMFEYIDFGDLKQYELTDEQIKKKVVKLQEDHYKKIAQQEKEELELKELQLKEEQRLINIQTDIKLKFDSNELSLTEEAKKQIQLKKEIEIVPPIKSRKKTITLKEGYLRWLEKKKNIDKVGNSSFKTYQSGYKYLTLVIDENRTVDNIEPYEISDLQNLLTQLPKNTFTYNKFKNKTLEEILE